MYNKILSHLLDDQLQIMPCPECGGDMYEPRILATMPPYKTYHIPAKKKSKKSTNRQRGYCAQKSSSFNGDFLSILVIETKFL